MTGAPSHFELGVPAGIVVYFEVPDIEAAVQRVRDLGGDAEEPGRERESGRYAGCRDDQGVAFGLRQPPE